MLSIIRDTEHSISLMKDQTQDMRQTNADLFNLHANDYVEAVADRRKLWLDNSRIRLNVQRELLQLPIDTFSDSAMNSGDQLGEKATIRLEQELVARKSEQAYQIAKVTVKAVSPMAPASKPAKPYNKPKPAKKKNANTNAQSFRGATQRGGGGSRRGGQPFTPNKKGKKSKKGSSD